MRKRLLASMLSIVLIATSVNVPFITVYAEEGEEIVSETASVETPLPEEADTGFSVPSEEDFTDTSADIPEETQDTDAIEDAIIENTESGEGAAEEEPAEETAEEKSGEEELIPAEIDEQSVYQVTFDANGGAYADGDTQKKVSVESGNALTETPNAPTYEGYEFSGWYIDADATEEIEVDEFIPEGDAIVYAGWEEELETETIEDTTWQNDYSFTQDDTNLKITLTFYNGTDATDITIPGKAIINGTEYAVYINHNSYVPFWRDSCDSLTSVSIEDTVYGEGKLRCLFADCSKLTSLDLSGLDTSNVTEMRNMFAGCSSLTNLDLSGFDTVNVTDMKYMFEDCSSLANLDLSGFNTVNVTDMSLMFYDCNSLSSLDLSHFDTSKVTTMERMFYNCNGLTSLDVSGFDTSNVTSAKMMFSGCSNLISLDLSSFNMNQAKDVDGFLSDCSSLERINAPTYFRILDVPLPSGKIWYDNNYQIISSIPTSLKQSYWITTPKREPGAWQNDFAYTLDEENKTITLIRYCVSGATELTIPGEATIGGEKYKVYITNKYNDHKNSFWGDSKTTLTSISFCDTVYGYDSFEYLFMSCSALASLDLSGLDTSSVTNMVMMFFDCQALPSLDVSNFDTSNVTNMASMFDNCSKLTSLDVSGFDTSKVTDIGSMFMGCSSLTSLDISGFDTSHVTEMGGTFWNCSSLTNLNLSGIDTSHVEYMNYMFDGCSSLTNLDLSGFDTSSLIGMTGMFISCTGLTSLDLSGFDASKILDNDYNATSVWYNCNKLKSIILNNTFSVIGRSSFNSCDALTDVYFAGSKKEWEKIRIDQRNECLTNATIHYDFKPETSWQNDYDYVIDDDNGTITLNWIKKSKATNVKIPGTAVIGGKEYKVCINTSKEDDFYFWADSTSTLTSVTITGTVYGGDSLYALFRNCPNLTQVNLEGLDTSRVTDMGQMFFGCNKLSSLDLSKFDTSNVTSMYMMFTACTGLTSLNISGFNTKNVTNMSRMFSDCNSLKTIDVSSFNTGNVTNLSTMFYACNNLTDLDLGSFDTSKVTDMSNMFSRCSNLTSLNVGGFNTRQVTNMERMFYNCGELVALNLGSFDMTLVNNADYVIDGCTSLKEIRTPKNVPFEILLPTDKVWYNEQNAVVTEIPAESPKSYCFTTDKKDMRVDGIETLTYTGNAIKLPALQVYDYETLLKEGTDYTVSYKNNTNAYTLTEDDPGFNAKKAPTITVTGKGNYTKNDVVYFTIAPKSLADKDITVSSIAPVMTSGKSKTITPSVTVTFGKTKLANKKNYTLEYYNAVKDDTGAYVADTSTEPMTTLVDNPGTYIVRINGIGNYTGSKDAVFTVAESTQILVSKLSISSIKDRPYTGKKQDILQEGANGEPALSVKYNKNLLSGFEKDNDDPLTQSEIENYDFYVTYSDDDDATKIGKHSVTITGTGKKYVGSKTITYNITGQKLSSVKFENFPSSIGYTGSAVIFKPGESYNDKIFRVYTKNGSEQNDLIMTDVKTYKSLTEETDPKKSSINCTYEYTNNVYPGTATVVFNGVNNFTGMVKKTFKITGKSFTNSNVVITSEQFTSSFTYDGKAKTQDIENLTFKVDKTNTESITGISVEKYNELMANEQKTDEEKAELQTYAYTYSYTNNVNAGTAKLILKGINGYTGTITKSFTIKKYDISKNTTGSFVVTKADGADLNYHKGGAKPKVTVTFNDKELSLGADYTVSYQNNSKVTEGQVLAENKKPAVVITGKGNFSGTNKDCKFDISQQSIAIVTVTAADVVWKDKTGNWKTTVKVTDEDGKALTAGKDYEKNIEYYLADANGEPIFDKPITAQSKVDMGTTIVVVVRGTATGSYGLNADTAYAKGTYRITEASIAKVIVAKPSVQTYTGSDINWKPTLYADKNAQKVGEALKEGTDYEIVSYTNNRKKGTAKVTIRGINGYGGEKTISFTIGSKSIIWWFRNTITNLTN